MNNKLTAAIITILWSCLILAANAGEREENSGVYRGRPSEINLANSVITRHVNFKDGSSIPKKEADYLGGEKQTDFEKGASIESISLDEDGETCETPLIIDSIPYADSGNTCDFADDCDIPFSDNSDVIYQMTLPEPVALEISLHGSLYDTKLAVFSEECCTGPGTEFAYNDDDNGPQSRIEEYFEAGTYFIVIDGYGNRCGEYHLHIIETDLPPLPPCPHYFVGPEGDDWNFWTSDSEIGPFIVYDNFWCNDISSIGAVRWWGVDLHDTGYNWEECDESAPEFEIKFYGDVYGFPDTLNPVGVYDVEPDRSPTGILYGEDEQELIEYYAEFEPCFLTEGWISIQGISNDGDNCGFLWAVSNDGDGSSYQRRFGSLIQLESDLARYLYDGQTGLKEDHNTPSRINILTNYPNPFNSSTVIAYYLDRPADVALDIYDCLGKNVLNLDSGYRVSGLHELVWNGRNKDGVQVSSGMYFCRFSEGKKASIRRMIYLK